MTYLPFISEHIENLTFDLILQNLAGKLVCLSIVVAYESSKCPFTKFSKLGHCDLIMAQYCHFKDIMKMCNFTPFFC